MAQASKPPIRISASMALDSLREQVDATIESHTAYKRNLAIRDDLIRECREARIPEATLIRITGLSRDSINRIANSPSRAYQ